MKRILAIIFALGVLLAPCLVFAADQATDTSASAPALSIADGVTTTSDSITGYDLFTPPITDRSLAYLGQVFGTVGGVVHGTSGQLLSEIFKVFNYGIIVLVGIFMIYTILMSVINTAAEGEFLSKKQGQMSNPAWLAFRVALGIGILVPKYTGYSLAQVFVMWVVVQGVGLADAVWERALTYLDTEGGVIYSKPLETPSIDKTFNSVSQVFQSSVCLYKVQAMAEKNKSDAQAALKNDPSNPTLQQQANEVLPSFHPVWNDDTKTVSFGYKSSNPETDTICGSYGWAKTGKQSEAYESYKKAGLQQIVLNVDSVAKAVVQSSDETLDDSQKDNLKNRVLSATLGATEDYENILMPALRGAAAEGEKELSANYKLAAAKGWIVAGSYYWDLANKTNSLDKEMKNYQPTMLTSIDKDTGKYGIDEQALNDAISQAQQYLDKENIKKIMELIRNTANSPISTRDQATLVQFLAQGGSSNDEQKQKIIQAVSPAKDSIEKTINPLTSGVFGTVLGLTGASVTYATYNASPAIAVVSGQFFAMLGSVAGSWFGIMNSPGDPVAMLQKLGVAFVSIAAAFWISMTATLGVMSTVVSTCSALNGLAFGTQNAMKFFAPVVLGVIGALFVNGMILSVYVPLIPFIIFTFAAIGWLISVLEAMVAAPLVAFGITHPEGHDLLGKGEQAVMLLLGVFLRPVVMIIGFLSAMVIARVALKIVNAGFSHVIEAAGITLSGFNVISIMGLMILYTFIIISLVNMVFNAGIVKLWETIWMWIGFHQPNSSVESALQEIKSGAHGGMQAAGEAMGGMVRGSNDSNSAGIERDMHYDKDGKLTSRRNKTGPKAEK